MRIFDTDTWQPGTVVRPAQQPRSYIVRNINTEAVYRRTRTHLKSSYNATTEEHAITSQAQQLQSSVDIPSTAAQSEHYVTRLARVSNMLNI